MKKMVILKILILMMMASSIMLMTACEQPIEDYPVACTLDAKECPDGSYVGRIAPDCEFEACPEMEITNFEECEAAGNPVMESSPRQCSANGETFVEEVIDEPIVGGDKDEHGCIGSAGYTWCEVKQKCLREWEEKCEEKAIENEDDKRYIFNSAEECDYADLNCEENEAEFFEEDACGCIRSDLVEPVLPKTFCLQKENIDYACTAEYVPVCGWFESTQIQCIKYPCAAEYSNGCEACKDTNVKYWTEGECPK